LVNSVEHGADVTRDSAIWRPAVAGQPSRDRQVDGSTNGAIAGEQGRIGPDAEVLEDDQTLADREQTLADADQTGSDSDQTASDNDQAAADSDQAASDRDVGRGGDRAAHDITRGIRDRSAQQRHDGAERRLHAAAARDAVARARDLRALARDQAAALRDRDLVAREAALSDDKSATKGAEIVERAEENRKVAADDRLAAVEARARAAADRDQAARDRRQAARDRAQAQADRDALLHQLAIAETDPLTGTRTRAPGLADLEHEIDRARRTTDGLAVAYVDIVGLKVENDTHGHAAGDALLQRAVRAIRDHLRSYDMVARIGGDEFLCVMSGATIDDARQRFDAVHLALAADPDPCEIKVGFAALTPEDTAADLIARADADLPNRHGR
jgi:diguanylate cyclase (GGDEF)-like protein